MTDPKTPQPGAVQHVTDHYSAVREDEVDLKELILGLWVEKWMIIGVTSVFSVIALTYALLATPFYKTEALLVTASEAQIEKINSLELIKLSREDNVAAIFSALTSRDMQQEFFLKNREAFDVYFKGGVDDKTAFGRFLKDGISVELPDPKKDEGKGFFIRVSTTLPAAVDAESLLTGFLKEALEFEQRNFSQNLVDLVSVKVERKKNEIESIKLELNEIRENRVRELEEARSIAQSLKLIEPASIATLAASRKAQGDTVISTVGQRDDALYLYGARFLTAEIETLKLREDSSFKDQRIPALNAEIARLQRLDVNNLTVSNSSDGMYLAQFKSSPFRNIDRVKPKLSLIVILGSLFGGMLGVFSALVRRLFM
ncbi:hypothetical protein R50072_19870 [Simiduia litorea]|uniref:Wzz/FepE/Etk N-terminal domain-containing protein n=1 Tax=Simiduia litorea TaxID=1435348 RepID=UPI0036F3E4FB